MSSCVCVRDGAGAPLRFQGKDEMGSNPCLVREEDLRYLRGGKIGKEVWPLLLVPPGEEEPGKKAEFASLYKLRDGTGCERRR